MDPKTLKYAPSHEWAHIEGDEATVGISQFAVEQLTDLLLIELPAVGTRLTPGQTFGEVESVKAVSDLFAPVGGEVIAVNQAVKDDVQVLAQDPFGDGWLLKVRILDPGTSVPATLMDHDAYQRKIAEESH